MSKEYSIEDLLDKLIGSTEPYGESVHDESAIERLDEVDRVLAWATDRLYQCRKAKNNYQYSMLQLAIKAREIAECYLETFDDLCEKSDKEKQNDKNNV